MRDNDLPPDANGKTKQNGRPAPPPHAVRILLIDDDAEHANLLREFLNDTDTAAETYSLTCVERLQAGLTQSATGRYDVILLGLELPDSHGLETYNKVRAQSPAIPVIAMADIPHEAVAMETMRRGAQDYLIKGTVDARLLKHVIRYAMMEARLESTVRRLRAAEPNPAAK